MTNDNQHNGRSKSDRVKRDERLSTDGLWRSYPKVPHLLCYVKSGMFYGRLKVDGKTIRRSLETTVFTDAKLLLADFIGNQRKEKPAAGTFGEALKRYEADLEASHEMGDNSKRYRRYCVQKLLGSWPDLEAKRLDRITSQHCKDWAKKFSKTINQTYFNNILGTLRDIFKIGGVVENPAMNVSRLGTKTTNLKLPEPGQFEMIIEKIETAGARESKNCANLVRFLAFSGCRISEANKVTWADVNMQRGFITVQNAKRRKSADDEPTRDVPIISDMATLLEKLKASNPAPEDRVCRVGECEKSLTNACKKAEVSRITHHDLRHLFATRCIESGVDIPTVAGWLGHKDRGVLAMKVYGHLRTEHSTEMAKKVSFSKPVTEGGK